MTLWHAPFTPEDINRTGQSTLPGHLGMECTEVGADFLRMRMPVDARTHQPAGLLHGGATVALAETVGGVASWHVIAPGSAHVVGQEINANHIRSARDGFVIATCRPLHIGRTSHVWDIRVENPDGKLISIVRLTNAVLATERKPG